MSPRDSDDDLRNFMPDLETILREADPAYGEKKLREALNNPELDQALAEVRQARTESHGPVALPITPPRPAPVRAPANRAAAGAVAGRRRRFPAWLVYTLAVLAVVGPVAMVMVLVKTPPKEVEPSARPAEARPESMGGDPMRATPAPTSDDRAGAAGVIDAGAETGADAGAETGADAGAAAGAATAAGTATGAAAAAATAAEKNQPHEPAGASVRDGSASDKTSPNPAPPKARDGEPTSEPSPAPKSPKEELETEMFR